MTPLSEPIAHQIGDGEADREAQGPADGRPDVPQQRRGGAVEEDAAAPEQNNARKMNSLKIGAHGSRLP